MSVLSDQISATVSSNGSEMIALRRELHQIPEPGLHLPETNARLRREFEALGMEITDAQEVSGFTAVLRGGAGASLPIEKRPIVLLRADMDALPVTEETGLSWASTNGAMHGCGHDMHMAGLVGAARALHAVREELKGDVVFFLQPGEEGWNGAQHLIDEGLLESAGRLPDHAYGLHVWSAQYPSGTIVSKPGALMASSDTINVRVHGTGGHGSAPHKALDPVPVAAEMVTQSHVVVTREFDIFDPVVVTCGSVVAGSTANVIPDHATAKFTLRAFDPETRNRLIDTLVRLFEGVAAAHGTTCEIEVKKLYPVTTNHDDETGFLSEVTEEVFPGRWSELTDPVGASEDFSKVLERIPGTFAFVAAVDPDKDPETAAFNHSPFATYDDSVLVDCSRLLAELAARRLSA
ncbi:M20 metallopeptidase family protein [Rothia koreensis]|uniref:M20 metallopeptidase family protein n=1 Tax=Rothia koreensis TaxID=592378 RepID=UPI003FCC7E48